METLKKLLTFREIEPFSLPDKTVHISENRNFQKTPYVFSKESLSYILETLQKLFMFQETELSCISGKV